MRKKLWITQKMVKKQKINNFNFNIVNYFLIISTDDKISLEISNINLTHEFDDFKSVETPNQINKEFNKTTDQGYYDHIGNSRSIENKKQTDESIEEIDSNEVERGFKKFDTNYPMWKNIIDTSKDSGNEDYTASKYANELLIENCKYSFSVNLKKIGQYNLKLKKII